MPFFVFKLIFACLFIGLLIVVALIARAVWRKRRLAAPIAPAPGPAAARPSRPTLGRKRAEPEPAGPAEPPPVRRRRLQPLSDFEASADLTPAPDVPRPQPEAAWADREDLSVQVLARLEHAFEEYQHGRITLAEYEALVRAEEAAITDRPAAPSDGGDTPDDVLAAQEAVRWCLDWAAAQRRPAEG